MTGLFARRSFLELAAAAALAPRPAIGAATPPAWAGARRIVRSGALGRVVFCQVSAPLRDARGWAEFARSATSGAAFAACAEARVAVVKFHGEEATMVVTESEYRIFHGAGGLAAVIEGRRAG